MEHTNPYATPDSEVAVISDEIRFEDVPWYSARGRLGRARYFLRTIGYYVVFVLGTSLLGVLGGLVSSDLVGLLMLPLALGYLFVALAQSVKRLHDMNWSGWWLLLMLIPLINLIFSLVMLFKPGSPGINDYGYPATPARNALLMVMLALLLIALIGILAAIAIPSYQDYISRIQTQ